jgi:hypothetical protein
MGAIVGQGHALPCVGTRADVVAQAFLPVFWSLIHLLEEGGAD